MAKTKEGIPVVTEKALSQTLETIRGRRAKDLLEEIEQENSLIAEAIRKLSFRSAPRDRRTVIEKDIAAVYMLIKTQGRLDQT